MTWVMENFHERWFFYNILLSIYSVECSDLIKASKVNYNNMNWAENIKLTENNDEGKKVKLSTQN